MIFRKAFRIILAGTGLILLLAAMRIEAKAYIAQYLLERSWREVLRGGEKTRPWPWADTVPIARLIGDQWEKPLIVCEGHRGRTLAFGPGHVTGTAAPGERGNCVIVGHRDTHFAVLRSCRVGGTLILETGAGKILNFRIMNVTVAHEGEAFWLEHDAADDGYRDMTLITCYPFDSLTPGGPLRYVVRARYVSQSPEPGTFL